MTPASLRLAVERAIVRSGRAVGLSIAYVGRAAYQEDLRLGAIATRFREFTMVPEGTYIENLRLAASVRGVGGDVVECGVWRGGMIAGIVQVLGRDRKYWLFDSFEGLPPARDIDGPAALDWQRNKEGSWYFDNCRAEEGYAREAMRASDANDVELVRGWFSDTVKTAPVNRIALLRLDCDWYDSTMACLDAFYPKISEGGITIIDDYYTWDGCARAVHDFLSRHSIADRVRQSPAGVAFIVKGRGSADTAHRADIALVATA